MLGPFIACERGYRKKSIITLLASRHFKVLAITSKIGSEHPIVGFTVVKTYLEKIENSRITSSQCSEAALENTYGALQFNVESFKDLLSLFTLSDDPTQLLGPEVIVAEHCNQPTFYAFAYQDIYDKKVGQKFLHFFLYGFLNVQYIYNSWVCTPKAGNTGPLKPLFNPTIGRNDTDNNIVEQILSQSIHCLTRNQRTAE
jgi:hypothetical protein